jgi:hypothetical protein
MILNHSNEISALSSNCARILKHKPAKYLPPPQQPETDWDAMPDEEAQAKVGEIISKLAAKLSAPKEDKPA